MWGHTAWIKILGSECFRCRSGLQSKQTVNVGFAVVRASCELPIVFPIKIAGILWKQLFWRDFFAVIQTDFSWFAFIYLTPYSNSRKCTVCSVERLRDASVYHQTTEKSHLTFPLYWLVGLCMWNSKMAEENRVVSYLTYCQTEEQTPSAVVKALSASLMWSPIPSTGNHRNIKSNTQLLEAARPQVCKPAVKTSAGLCRSTLMDHGIEITSV